MGKPNNHQVELIEAAQKGVPKYTFPQPPAKGNKVSEQSAVLPCDEAEADVDDATRKTINTVKSGTSVDEVSINCLATCGGVIVTFGAVSPGKMDKIVAHIGLHGGHSAIIEAGQGPSATRASRTGPGTRTWWTRATGRKSTCCGQTSTGEIRDMVDSGGNGKFDAETLTGTLNSVLAGVREELEKSCRHCSAGPSSRRRAPRRLPRAAS